jgi:serine/threonine-protein kinase
MRTVGRYQLNERIGEGAMADVYRAFDPEIGRSLAIKLLKPEYRQSEECCSRFLREARAAGVLSHPGIVTIHDVGESEGDPYIAMELLDGEPLDDLLKRTGPFGAEHLLSIGLQLVEALAYAHGLGVVHRDVKPSNVMISRDGRSAKLLDFGIARVVEAHPTLDGENLKTQVGQVIGTPRYMSPEQAQGMPLDGRSDLFSLGVVLYEMATGVAAFPATTAATLALQITMSDPEPIALRAPGCPRGLQFIIEKLIAKKPEKRFADGAQAAAALRREQAGLTAVLAEGRARGHGRRLPIEARMTLIMTGVTAIALVIGTQTMLSRQYAAMERVALTSGSTIAEFVASNAALSAVENATLPAAEQDWAPIAAFVTAASHESNVKGMTVVDANGIVRGASDQRLIGERYHAPAGEKVVNSAPGEKVSKAHLAGGGDGFRFVRPILYAGRPFGTVDLTLSNAELERTAQLSQMLISALAALILLVVAGTSYLVARALAGPIRRLRAGLEAVAAGDLDMRISHRRADEFGDLFDCFNRLAGELDQRVEQEDLAATQLSSPPAPAPSKPALPRKVA